MLITDNPEKDDMIKKLTLLLEEDGFFYIEDIRSSLIFKRGRSSGILGAGEYVCIHNILEDEVTFLFYLDRAIVYNYSCTADIFSNYSFAFSFITLYYKFILEVLSNSPGFTFKLNILSSNPDNTYRFIMIGYDKNGKSSKTIHVANPQYSVVIP